MEKVYHFRLFVKPLYCGALLETSLIFQRGRDRIPEEEKVCIVCYSGQNNQDMQYAICIMLNSCTGCKDTLAPLPQPKLKVAQYNQTYCRKVKHSLH